jgi:ABC-type glycerol-3-phosphate transport system substrate-binding protein
MAVLMVAACLAGCTNTAATESLPLVPAAGPGSGTIVWLTDPTAETATNDVRQVLADAFEQAYYGSRTSGRDLRLSRLRL